MRKYVDAIEQNALRRRVSGLAVAAGFFCIQIVPAVRSAVGGGSMVHPLDFDLRLHRLWRSQMAAAPGITLESFERHSCVATVISFLTSGFKVAYLIHLNNQFLT